MCSCSSSRHRQFRWTALAGQCLLSGPASHGGMTSWHARKSQVLQAKHVTWTDHYQDAQTQTPSTAAHHDKSFTALSQHCQLRFIDFLRACRATHRRHERPGEGLPGRDVPAPVGGGAAGAGAVGGRWAACGRVRGAVRGPSRSCGCGRRRHPAVPGVPSAAANAHSAAQACRSVYRQQGPAQEQPD